MTEFSRNAERPFSETEAGALALITRHWLEYNAVPKDQRLGDPERWDDVLYSTLRELGIETSKAQEICNLGKMQASLFGEIQNVE